MRWYGLDYDQGPIYQSKNISAYQEYAKQLVANDKAYYCFCDSARLDQLRKFQTANRQAPRYDGQCRELPKEEVEKNLKDGQQYVIRLKVLRTGSTVFADSVYGNIEVQNKEIDDQVLIKSDGFPTYHLANVVDDHQQGVTHVIRAEEWLPSTPKHILLYEAFGWQLPDFVHLPIVLGQDKTKLSKRHGAVAALDYRRQGYLPEAILNFIALLGWNPKTNNEIFTRQELIEEFDLSKINKSSAVFNLKKLDWLNGSYIRKMPVDKLAMVCQEFTKDKKIDDNFVKAVALAQDRMKKLSDINEAAEFYFTNKLSYDPEILIPAKEEKDRVIGVLKKTISFIEALSDEFNDVEKLKASILSFINDHGYSNKIVLWPIRVAISGKKVSPGVFEMMEVLGKEEVLKRVQQALDYLQKS